MTAYDACSTLRCAFGVHLGSPTPATAKPARCGVLVRGVLLAEHDSCERRGPLETTAPIAESHCVWSLDRILRAVTIRLYPSMSLAAWMAVWPCHEHTA